jgi:hypothetical protein
MATPGISQESVEALERVLSYLVKERQRLRSDGADPLELEANRRAIGAMQIRLGHAHGGRYASKRTDRAD